jgi:phosphate transport system permease protein
MRHKGKHLYNSLFTGFIYLLCAVAVLPLFFICAFIFSKGIMVLNFDFLTQVPKPLGEIGGGIANALVGSVLTITVATIMATPLGVLVGIALAEFPKNWIVRMVAGSIDLLQGVPTILLGISAYTILVAPFGSFNAFAGSAVLAFIMIPIIARQTQESIQLVPNAIKEASFALGANTSDTLLKCTIPVARNGIISGIVLSIGRVAGETAPLLFTAFGNPYMSIDLFAPIETLPHLIFNYATSPYEEWHNQAWGAAFILLSMLLLLQVMIQIRKKRLLV